MCACQYLRNASQVINVVNLKIYYFEIMILLFYISDTTLTLLRPVFILLFSSVVLLIYACEQIVCRYEITSFPSREDEGKNRYKKFSNIF